MLTERITVAPHTGLTRKHYPAPRHTPLARLHSRHVLGGAPCGEHECTRGEQATRTLVVSLVRCPGLGLGLLGLAGHVAVDNIRHEKKLMSADAVKLSVNDCCKKVKSCRRQ